MPSAIKITLYNTDNEIVGEFERTVIPWGLLKRAIRLSEEINAANAEHTEPEPTDWLSRFKRWLHRNDRKVSGEEQMMDQIASFVVDVFGGKFTVKQLDEGAEIGEMMAILQAIISRAQVMVPTNPPPKASRKRH
jgi:hypothetical protein